MRFFVFAAAAFVAAQSHDRLLQEAEDEAEEKVRAFQDEFGGTTFTMSSDGNILGSDDADDEDPLAWAAGMTELRLGEDGVEDEILPTIAWGADAATLMDAPSAKAIAVMGRKQIAGHLQVEVLENQLVIIHGMENKEDRANREKAGVESSENALATELACRPIHGRAMFLLAHRYAVPGSPHIHELAFFDRELWDSFAEYIRLARATADFFGGGAVWTMRIHWQTLPREQRVPWVQRRATLQVAATPSIRAPQAAF